MSKVIIRSVTQRQDYEIDEYTIVLIDGKQVGPVGDYGGPPEDNNRYRNYKWVETMIMEICKTLGADVEIREEKILVPHGK